MRHQQDAVEAGHLGEAGDYWPTNADLLKVLKRWTGVVCLEINTDAPPINVKVVKTDLTAEIERCWQLDDICNLEISCVSHGHGVLVLSYL